MSSDLPRVELTLNTAPNIVPTSSKQNINTNSGTFQTSVNIIVTKNDKVHLPPLQEQKNKCPNFFDATPPPFDQNNLSLTVPVDLVKIKKNAINSLAKPKFAHLLQNTQLNELVDALISDSFWFIICFFQRNNKPKGDNDDVLPRYPKTTTNKATSMRNQSKGMKTSKEVNQNQIKDKDDGKIVIILQTLKRMSCNYFKFFIRVCDMGPSRKNDPVLSVVRDFMAQCVYYSIYLAFPKSRYLFGEEFRNRIVVLFAYLYNGLVSENNFVSLHWELDLGKGNIIENWAKYKDEAQLKLPEIADLQKLLEMSYKRKTFCDAFTRKRKLKNKKEEINSDLLNTPLYRLYAETNKFETLNLLKPIKLSNRKIIDINQVSKQHASYVKFARDTLKKVQERKEMYDRVIAEKEAEFQNQIAEVKQNNLRTKKEFSDIKIQRGQEYANYCIFISSK